MEMPLHGQIGLTTHAGNEMSKRWPGGLPLDKVEQFGRLQAQNKTGFRLIDKTRVTSAFDPAYRRRTVLPAPGRSKFKI